MSNCHTFQLLYIEPDREIGRQAQAALSVSHFNVSLAETCVTALTDLTERRYDVVALAWPVVGERDMQVLNEIILKPDGPAVLYLIDSSPPVPSTRAAGVPTSEFLIKDRDGHFLSRLDIALRSTLDKHRLKQEREKIKSELSESIGNLRRDLVKQEILVREMNHRIGNSLQLVVSMIRIVKSRAILMLWTTAAPPVR